MATQDASMSLRMQTAFHLGVQRTKLYLPLLDDLPLEVQFGSPSPSDCCLTEEHCNSLQALVPSMIHSISSREDLKLCITQIDLEIDKFNARYPGEVYYAALLGKEVELAVHCKEKNIRQKLGECIAKIKVYCVAIGFDGKVAKGFKHELDAKNGDAFRYMEKAVRSLPSTMLARIGRLERERAMYKLTLCIIVSIVVFVLGFMIPFGWLGAGGVESLLISLTAELVYLAALSLKHLLR